MAGPLSPRRAAALLAAACLLGPWRAAVPAGQAESAAIERMRVGFTLNFIRYTSWPAAAEGAFALCVAANEPQSAAFAEADGATVKGRPLRVRRVEHPAELGRCDALYLGSVQSADARPWLQGLDATRPTLTVGEGPSFLAHGGMIRLAVAEQQMKFDIHLAPVARARLVLSPQLLRLARQVEGTGP